MITQLLMIVAAGVATVHSYDTFLNNRDLQASGTQITNTMKKMPPVFYGDDIKINHNTKLGCGACIRGGFIYCIPGAEGSDPSTWGGKNATCCADKANCKELNNTAYLCSSTYGDLMLAKAMCPFNKTKCGNAQNLDFTEVNQKQAISVTL